MRRPVAAIALVLLLSAEASAQVAAGQPARTVASRAEIASQATFDASYLLARYMTQLAAAGAAPSQADIDEATRDYFTNGAALTSVPSSGPGAAYFHDGAAVASLPNSGPRAAYFHNGAEVTAYHAAPRVTPAPDTTDEAGAGWAGSVSHPEDAGVQRAVVSTDEVAPTRTAAVQPAAPSEVRIGASTATGPTCSPLEIEAAMAIASKFATVAASPASGTSCTPPTASIPMPAETGLTLEAEAAPNCPPGPPLLSRLAAALGGAFFGALAIALWSRPRPLGVAERR